MSRERVKNLGDRKGKKILGLLSVVNLQVKMYYCNKECAFKSKFRLFLLPEKKQ